IAYGTEAVNNKHQSFLIAYSYQNGKKKGDRHHHTDKEAPTGGWWRVDVGKNSTSISHACFRGECMQLSFPSNLDSIRSVYLSGNIDAEDAYIQLRQPNIEAKEVGQYGESNITIPSLPIDHNIDMSILFNGPVLYTFIECISQLAVALFYWTKRDLKSVIC
ncbi:hypothetical protein PFISCL1PPCAC_7734, partial [Pristionchus fissidentatus]